MTIRTSRWLGLVALAVALLVITNPAQATRGDDGNVIKCSDLASCFGVPAEDSDLSGPDASNITSVGGDEGPDLTPVDQDPITQPTTTDQAATNPQVVTPPTPTASVAATTTSMPAKPVMEVPKLAPPPPYCLNHPDYTPPLPQYWFRGSDGNCYYSGPPGYGLCKGDLYNLVSLPDVDSWLGNGYGMGIYVDGAGADRKLNCLITDLTTYGLNPKDFVFSGKYVQDGGPGDGPGGKPFDTPTPYAVWKPLYAYWVLRSTAAQYVATQSTVSIQAYGLLWYDGNRYQNANTFTKYLKKNQTSWRSWKKSNHDLAAALVTHQRLLRRR